MKAMRKKPDNKKQDIFRTRFAPSPTGRLHIGHAYSALFAYEKAISNNGTFILRIEDIDSSRCRPKYESGIFDDLAWLGIEWEEPARKQSAHFDDYQNALKRLQDKELLYPCFCTRKDIQQEVQRADSAPHGPEGALYPGTCRTLTQKQRDTWIEAGAPYALRLDMAKSLESVSAPLVWHDADKGKQTATPEILGDVVLARKDTPASYHLCVTLDDHLQNISCVTRGDDLFYATHLHRLLQELLDLDVPQYHHHTLLLDESGKRFAKRNNAVTLQHMREIQHLTPQDIKDKIRDYL